MIHEFQCVHNSYMHEQKCSSMIKCTDIEIAIPLLIKLKNEALHGTCTHTVHMQI